MAMDAADAWEFRYAPTCSMPACDQTPMVKIAAVWSNGPLQEWKNYGLACGAHTASLLARARDRRHALAVSEDEQVGPVEVVPLADRTASLARIASMTTLPMP